MTTTLPMRSRRMTALACLTAAMGVAAVAAPAQADEAGAHSFIVQETQRTASLKETPAKTAAKGKATKASPETAKSETPDRKQRVEVVIRGRSAARPQKASVNPLSSAPESIRAIVRQEAAANGVPLTLAKAVVTVESRWNPRVTGSAGEVGLMQIKYPTARMMGYRGTRAALYDPATNIKWGMKYLAGAHRLAGGDICGTVSRYQGGHGVRGVTRMGAVYCRKAKAYIAAMPAGTGSRIALNDRSGDEDKS